MWFGKPAGSVSGLGVQLVWLLSVYSKLRAEYFWHVIGRIAHHVTSLELRRVGVQNRQRKTLLYENKLANSLKKMTHDLFCCSFGKKKTYNLKLFAVLQNVLI